MRDGSRTSTSKALRERRDLDADQWRDLALTMSAQRDEAIDLQRSALADALAASDAYMQDTKMLINLGEQSSVLLHRLLENTSPKAIARR